MSSRSASRTAWGLMVLYLILTALGYWLARLNGSEDITAPESLPLLFGFASFAIVGSLIVAKRPKHPIGWLFSTVGILSGGSLLGGEYSTYAGETSPGSLPAASAAEAMSSIFWVGAIVCILLTLLLVPTGKVLSSRWRPIAWMVPVALVLFAVTDQSGPGLFYDVAEIVGSAIGILLIVAALLSIILRYRRSRGEERLQLKWFVFAIAFLVAMVAIHLGFGRFLPQLMNNLVFAGSVAALPIGTGVAILRYRLYGIDLIINKTVVYGGLAAFITAVYVGVVVGFGALVGAGDKPNLALSLAATGIVAVAFQPMRERTQRFANKLVYGERVTPYEAITSFSHRMAESLSLDQVLPQMAEAAAKGVGGNRSQVKLFLPRGGEQVVSWPTDSSGDFFDRTISVTHQAEDMGEISVAKAPGEQITKSEENLLQDLASQAGLAMRNLRLTGELQQRLVELRESRSRIVKAQDEERRRMERDITDGPQQQLGKIAAKLGLAHSLARSDADKAARLLDEVKVESDAAIESVRDLARGLFPKILADRGLSAAIEAHISKTGIRAIVQDETNGARFSPDVEANVYFCIREALQMAPKRPAAAPIAVSLAIVDFTLEFSVRDGGHSERATLPPSVQNIQDRLEALGGSFDIQSAPEGGTELLGLIPIKAMEPAS